MDEDIDLVVNCLKHHDIQNVEALRESLLMIALLCTENDEVQNKFREGGGLGYSLNLLTSVDSNDVRGAILYTLGCATDGNLYTQRRLCSDALFKFLQCQITSPKAPDKLKSSAAYFLSCLVTNNSTGQNIIRSSGCLDGLLSILGTLLECSGSSTELWMGIVKALCSCVNNPRNGENQLLCGTIFPRVLRTLERTDDPAVIQLISYFISLTVEDSDVNQERLGIISGLEVLASTLQDMVESFIRQPTQQTMVTLSRLVTTLGIASSDHEGNCDILTELQAIPLLVQILSLDAVTAEVKLKVILTLSSVTRSSEPAQKQLVNSEGLVLLVQTLLENQSDEEMSKAITSVMETCIGWVSALGTENLLYSNTLGLLSGRAPASQKKPKPPITCGGPNFLLDRLRQSISRPSGEPNTTSLARRPGFKRSFQGQSGKTEANNANTTESVLKDMMNRLKGTNDGFERTQRKELPLNEAAEPISVKRQRTGSIIKEPTKIAASPPEPQEEPLDLTNDTSSVSSSYGYIQKKLGMLEDKFDKVLNYLNSFRSQEKDTSGTSAPNETPELQNKSKEDQPSLEKVGKEHNTETNHYETRNVETDSYHRERGSQNQIQAVKSVPATQPFGTDTLLLEEYPSRKNVGRNCELNLTLGISGGSSEKLEGINLSRDQNDSSVDVRAVDHSVGGFDQDNVCVNGAGDCNISGRSKTASAHAVDKSCSHTSEIGMSQLPSSVDPNDGERREEGKRGEQAIYCQSCNKESSTGGNGSMQSRGRLPERESRAGHVTSAANGKPSEELRSHSKSNCRTGAGNRGMVTVSQTEEDPVSDHEAGGNGGDCPEMGLDGDRADDRRSFSSSHRRYIVKQRAGEMMATALPPRNEDMEAMDAGQEKLVEDLPHGPKCPGCGSYALLNSHTFIKTLMSSVHTCTYHKILVSKVRAQYKARIERLVHRTVPSTPFGRDIYSFSEDESLQKHSKEDNTPLVSQAMLSRNRERKRRQRQDFSQDEICNLLKGVRHHGRHWNAILCSYQFKKGRTSVDLKDKYRRLVKDDSHCRP